MHTKNLNYTNEELETIINSILIPKLQGYEHVSNLDELIKKLRYSRQAALVKPVHNKLSIKEVNEK